MRMMKWKLLPLDREGGTREKKSVEAGRTSGRDAVYIQNAKP